MKEFGIFAFTMGGTSWMLIGWSDKALIILGLIGFAVGLFCLRKIKYARSSA